MSIQAVAWAISQRVGSPTGKVLLMCLANYANEKGECWPSQKTISHEAELSERSTRDWLQKLEAQGFISRSRRHRSDGSRTSDHVVLNLSLAPKSGDNDLTADSAARPVQAANGSKPSGSSRRTYRQELPGIEPSPKPLEEPSSGARARRTEGFKKLWEDWPTKERPEKIKAAQWAFDKLTPDEQDTAVTQARRFRRLAKAKKDMALMIPYLKQRQFADLDGAPEINADGKFVITPQRPEWPAWKEHLREKYSDAAVERLEARQSFFADFRWPPTDTTTHDGLSNAP